jgi:DNA-binding GntR family transcriptional regulator
MAKPISTSTRLDKSGSMSTEQLVDWAREKIRVGQFAPGQRLIESDIIRETKVTRNKVRDAFQRLATEGLVTIAEFRGASVKLVTWDEVRQIYHARMALEGFAAALFAESDDMARKKELQAIQVEMDQWVSSGDHDRFARLNSKWHDLIIKSANNAYFEQFLSRLTIPIYRLLFTTFYSRQRIELANADHKEITAAILQGRAKRAEKLMRAHVHAGLKALSETDFPHL